MIWLTWTPIPSGSSPGWPGLLSDGTHALIHLLYRLSAAADSTSVVTGAGDPPHLTPRSGRMHRENCDDVLNQSEKLPKQGEHNRTVSAPSPRA